MARVVTVQQPPPMIISQPAAIITRHPGTMGVLNINVQVTRGLGITQIVIGALTFILGIVVVAVMKHYWVNNSGTAIVAGIWIVVTGVLGVFSSQQKDNSCLNGTHMAFNIIATVGVFIDGCIFAAALGYYNTCDEYNWVWYRGFHETLCSDYVDLGRGLYGFLLFLMIVEFFIALTAAIYCCQASPSCCGGRTTGVIVQQQQPQVVLAPQQIQTQQYPIAQPQYPMHQQTKTNYYPPQQPLVNQNGVMTYPQQTQINQPAYQPPPPNQPPPVYQEFPNQPAAPTYN